MIEIKMVSKPIRPAIQFIKETLGENLVGAELGVLVGSHAIDVCNFMKMKKYYQIDNWERAYGFRTLNNRKIIIEGDGIYKRAKLRIDKYPEMEIIKKNTMDALEDIKDESLDFVYIDADHAGKAVYADIQGWVKKVKVGGVVAGHDFGYRREPDLTRYVLKYVRKKNLTLMHKPHDWWFINEGEDV